MNVGLLVGQLNDVNTGPQQQNSSHGEASARETGVQFNEALSSAKGKNATKDAPARPGTQQRMVEDDAALLQRIAALIDESGGDAEKISKNVESEQDQILMVLFSLMQLLQTAQQPNQSGPSTASAGVNPLFAGVAENKGDAAKLQSQLWQSGGIGDQGLLEATVAKLSLSNMEVGTAESGAGVEKPPVASKGNAAMLLTKLGITSTELELLSQAVSQQKLPEGLSKQVAALMDKLAAGLKEVEQQTNAKQNHADIVNSAARSSSEKNYTGQANAVKEYGAGNYASQANAVKEYGAGNYASQANAVKEYGAGNYADQANVVKNSGEANQQNATVDVEIMAAKQPESRRLTTTGGANQDSGANDSGPKQQFLPNQVGLKADGTANANAVNFNRVYAESGAVANRDIIQQLVQRLRVGGSEGRQELEVQLKPEALGKVAVKVEQTAHGIVARIAVENQAVRQAVQQNLLQLKETMQQQGVKVDQIDVQLGGSGNNPQFQTGSEGQFYGGSAGGDYWDSENNAEFDEPPVAHTEISAGRVNYLA